MKKLKNITIDKQGNALLNGKKLENIFPISHPEYFNGQDYFNWREEMNEKAPENAKYFTFNTSEGTYMNGMEPMQYTKAVVQFYGQK